MAAANTKTKSKAKAQKKASAKRKTSVKLCSVPNHRFPAGAKIGAYPASEVTVERGLGREPIPKATKEATVKKNGKLEFRGLAKGQYLAAGEVDGRYRYVGFSVK
jgi:hypothetical protein